MFYVLFVILGAAILGLTCGVLLLRTADRRDTLADSAEQLAQRQKRDP